MAAKFESGLEPAPHDFPEVSHGYGYHQPLYQHPHHQPPYHQPPYDPSAPLSKPELPGAPSTYGSQTAASPFSLHAQPDTAHPERRSLSARTICGCSLLVSVLSCIIALLSAAVIGLAAATGLESQRASTAAASVAALNASLAAIPTATPTGTAAAVLDDGCSDNPAGVDGTIYTSFALLGPATFTRHCNKDAPNPPLLSLFTSAFATCMDACAAYNKYVVLPARTGGTSSSSHGRNATCEAVSFIPAWTSKSIASAGGAPGNCYLKGGPQNETGLNTPNIGVACHAAILALGDDF